jgi:HEAT repeat protein
MRRALPLVVVLSVLGGCGRTPPTLAGGKPVPHWVRALNEPDARLRKTAVFKLGNVGATDGAVLPALLAALQDRDAGVRREAILALMKFGPGARPAVAVLTELQGHDRDAGVRASAARALQRLGRGTDPAP